MEIQIENRIKENEWSSGRVAEGGTLLRCYVGLILHPGFKSLLLRIKHRQPNGCRCLVLLFIVKKLIFEPLYAGGFKFFRIVQEQIFCVVAVFK